MATTSDTDKSPRAANQAPPTHVAEVSNYEIVRHYFDARRRPPRARATTSARSCWSPYREVQVQIPVQLSRRQDPRLLRLPRPAQRRARPLQGRHPLPPRGRPRRGARARLADDLEDRGRRRPVRRREGRRQLRPADELERAELQQITRSFMDKIEKVLGPTRDIPAPDVNTNAQVMAWMMDEYGKLHGHTPAIVHRQADRARGLATAARRRPAAACVYMFREAAPAARASARPTRRFVVQGFGNVGSWAARIIAAARREDGRRLRRARRDPQRRRASTPTRSHDHVDDGGKLTEFDGRRGDRRPTSCSRSSATSSSPRRSAA